MHGGRWFGSGTSPIAGAVSTDLPAGKSRLHVIRQRGSQPRRSMQAGSTGVFWELLTRRRFETKRPRSGRNTELLHLAPERHRADVQRLGGFAAVATEPFERTLD